MDYLELTNRHTGETLHMRRMHNRSGQIIMTLDGSLPPGGDGPPYHVHFFEHETGTVVSGTLGAKVGGKTFTVPAGGSVDLPPRVPHCWRNAGDTLLEFHGQCENLSGLDRYLQGIFAILNAAPAGRPNLFYLAHLAWRHRDTQQILSPPPAVQRVLFPIVIAVGKLLGKYRGDAWPGSPASCTGAPLVERARVA